MPTYHATFTTDPRSVVLARNAISRFARICGFAERDVADIRIAAGEALIASAEHSRSLRGGGFSVYCSFESDELQVEIQESRTGQTPDAANSYGTIIMRSLMNDVSYSKGGTRVRLVKRLETA